ncbi:MAG: tetratricopeptide repeat protein [Alphaproteobacteria bacterium]
MKLGSHIAIAVLLFSATTAAAGQAEYELCLGESANVIIRMANCDLAIRIGGLSDDQMIVALFNRGQTLLQDNQPGRALEDFDAILKLKPDDSEALYTRAIARRQLKQYPAAIADFDRLIAMGYQPLAKTYLQRSMAHYQAGNKEKTLADLHEANKLAPKDLEISDRLWKTEHTYKLQGQ